MAGMIQLGPIGPDPSTTRLKTLKVRSKRNIAVAFLAAAALMTGGVLAIQPAAPAAAEQGTSGLFVPLTGQVANTLLGEGLPKTKLAGWTPKKVQVAGVAGIPVDNVSAVALTVVAQNTTSAGQMSLGPGSGELSGVMRYMANDITTNTAIAEVDENGQIQVQVTTPADIVLKVQGYYTAGNGTVAAGGYQSVTMTRTVDTVNGVGLPQSKISGGQTVSIQVTGKAGVPTGAAAAFVNFQVNSPVGSTGSINPYATSPTSRPSNALSFPANNPNFSIGAIVPLDASGKFQLYLSPGSTIDLLMDVEGYFKKSDNAGAGAFTPAVAKVYDTRATARVAPNAIVTVPLAGKFGMPSMKAGLSATVLNLTVSTTGTAGGSIKAWPSGVVEPIGVGDLTFKTGMHTNLMTVAVGTDGAIKLHNRSADQVDLILDLEGWYASTPQPIISCETPYSDGSWTKAIPAAPVNCTIQASLGSAESVRYSVDSGEEQTNENTASTRSSVNLPIAVEPFGGEHLIEATGTDADGNEYTRSFEFTLGDWTKAGWFGTPSEGQDAALTPVLVASTDSDDPYILPKAALRVYTISENADLSSPLAVSDALWDSYTVPEGLLKDGKTYYWSATASGPSDANDTVASVTTPIYSFVARQAKSESDTAAGLDSRTAEVVFSEGVPNDPAFEEIPAVPESPVSDTPSGDEPAGIEAGPCTLEVRNPHFRESSNYKYIGAKAASLCSTKTLGLVTSTKMFFQHWYWFGPQWEQKGLTYDESPNRYNKWKSFTKGKNKGKHLWEQKNVNVSCNGKRETLWVGRSLSIITRKGKNYYAYSVSRHVALKCGGYK